MQRFLLLPAVLLLGAVSVAAALHAREAPPAANTKEQALKRLDELAKELDELEQRISEERIKARMDVVEKEQRQNAIDRAVAGQTQQLATEMLNLEKQAREIEAITVQGKEPNRIVVALRNKIEDLRQEQDRLASSGRKTREELTIAEERFRYLEHKHDNQRRFLNLKIELVEQELFGNREGVERRKLEQSLEAIRRDLTDLQRKLDNKPEPKNALPK